jgi:hypothetical protein
MYVVDDNGQRLVCPHPGEYHTVIKVLGVETLLAKREERYSNFIRWLRRLLGLSSGSNLFRSMIMARGDENDPLYDLIHQRTGFNSYCLCLDCLQQFKLDIEKDNRICPVCASNRVKTEEELVGSECPKCGKGDIEKLFTGVQC